MTRTPKSAELEAMTWNQLAELAKKRGMPYSFSKAELVNRLSSHSADGAKPAKRVTQRRRTRRTAGPTTAADYAQLFKEFTERVTSKPGAVTVAFDDADHPSEAVALISLK